MLFSWDELTRVTQGVWDGSVVGGANLPGIETITTDSRTMSPGSMFLALAGERYDGHNFIAGAVTAGAAAVCASRLTDEQRQQLNERRVPCLLVANTLTAYQALARAHRRRLHHVYIIAVTGSSGKTSTKEIIGAIVNEHFSGNILITQGNTNNQIGVPFNILQLRDRHRAAVIEMGTNAPGEIAALVDVARPDCAVLTNVGPVHLHGLGSVEGVLQEKAAIFGLLAERAGAGVVPHRLRHHPLVSQRAGAARLLSFGTESDADVFVRHAACSMEGDEFDLIARGEEAPLRVRWRISGAHNALNAAAGYAVAKVLGIGAATALRGLQAVKLPKMRMQVEERDGVCWINDAYNANPDSVHAFIVWLAAVAHGWTGRRYLILGDMLELGPDEQKYHDDILTTAKAELPDFQIAVVGERMGKVAARHDMASFRDAGEARDWLCGQVQQGDWVALKGSRGMALETILEPAASH